jgi:hypothetical protein
MTAIVLIVAVPLTLWAIGLHFALIPSGSQETVGRGQEVERLEQALKRREEARHQAVQELLAQRCTLKETLLRFQALNREWPDIIAMARVAGAEWSDEEIAYQLILKYVEMALSGQAEESTAALRRVEHDYQQLHAGSPRPILSSRSVQPEP